MTCRSYILLERTICAEIEEEVLYENDGTCEVFESEAGRRFAGVWQIFSAHTV
jgi:hypothetical protein